MTAGHVYVTDCKKGLPPRGLEFLKEVCTKVTIPVYAIGGIHAGTGQIQENGLWGIRRLHHVGDDENLIEYELIRSNRKTLTIQVKPDRSVIVRAPVRLAKYRIAKFVKDLKRGYLHSRRNWRNIMRICM